MCQFFSLVSDGKGKVMYFDWKLREKCLKSKLPFEPDSHTSIATHFGYEGAKEDSLNKYEYNPLTKKFEVDQLNTKDDSKYVEVFCKKLDFKLIVPQLIIKPIVHPFKIKPQKVTKADIQLLKQWDSVGGSVKDLIWNSVGGSVGDSIWDSVGGSIWGYTSSFFNLPEWKYIKHKKGVNPYQCVIDLWEKGLVPSFNGTTWRLHTGEKAKIVFEITKEKLLKA